MSGRSMLKFMAVIYERHRYEQRGISATLDGSLWPPAHRLPGLGRRRKWLGRVRRALAQTPISRLFATSGAQLGRWSMRLRFWNHHQKVIHLVALHKVILLQQLVARLRCLTKYNFA